MPPELPNVPVPDELAAVRDQIRSLTTREEELRRLLLTNPDLREGAAFLAEIKTTQQRRTDLKELRAAHPDIVAEFTHPVELTRIELVGITEDGELVSRRKLRTA